MTGKLLLMIPQKCLAGMKFHLKIEFPNFNYSNATVLFRSPSGKKVFLWEKKEWVFFCYCWLTHTHRHKKRSNKRKTFTAFPLLVLGKHNKATAGRHIFFLSI